MRKLGSRLLSGLSAALLGVAVAAASGAVAQDQPRLVAVNYALQYLAERLVGEGAEVVLPVPRDVDPSFWRPSIADISAIQSADLILLNGAGFATWVDRVSLPRARVVNTSAAVKDRFIVTENITHSHGEGGEHSHEGLASYTWLDPSLAAAQAEAIASALVSRDLAPASEVEARLDALRADLDALDAAASAEFADAEGVALIATHPRYQYFARRYGLSMAYLEWEAGAAPTEDGLSDLKALIDETGARILIWEAAPPQAALESVEALGLTSVVFDPLSQDPEEASFIEYFAGAIAGLGAALKAQPGN